MRDIQKIVREVLEDGHLMSLGTVDHEGVWVADVVYVFDEDLNIYWLSRSDARHSLAIVKHPQVAGTIAVSRPHEEEIGVQFSGDAEKLEGDFLDLARAHCEKRGKLPPLEEGEILKERGQSWYRLELIYEPLFDYEKKVV
ncbi:MAG: pyridoxamine 5'-phosphate oxidase family protein [Patescibacteria group bacterium]